MTAYTGTGALNASVCTASGAGVRHVSGLGILQSSQPLLAGAGKFAFTGSGALTLTRPTLSSLAHQGFRGSGQLSGPHPLILSSAFTPNNEVWDNDDSEWGQADSVYSEAKPVMLVGNEFYQADSGVKFGDTDIEVSLTRTGLTIIGRDRFGQWIADSAMEKTIAWLYPVIKAEKGTVISLWVGTQEETDQAITWMGPIPFRCGIDSYQDFGITGRYIAVRFTSSGQLPWELSGYKLDIDNAGAR